MEDTGGWTGFKGENSIFCIRIKPFSCSCNFLNAANEIVKDSENNKEENVGAFVLLVI